jgi:hypothetical protein
LQRTVNFFSHATLASWHSADPRFLLGSMLPDLVGMMGTRIEAVTDPELAAGVEYHHATDAAFHHAPVFTQLCAEAIAELTEQAVERGTARAVAHVGVELLLDGVLSFDRVARARYAQALGSAVDAPLEGRLALRRAGDQLRLQRGIARLQCAPVPEGFREPDFVAERLRDILGRRPRLAMRDGDFEVVRLWAHATRPRVAAHSCSLLDQVRQGLATASTAAPAAALAADA